MSRQYQLGNLFLNETDKWREYQVGSAYVNERSRAKTVITSIGSGTTHNTNVNITNATLNGYTYNLLPSLISYWPMDEASGNAIDAHGSNDLTDNNTVGTATGKVNNGRDFEDTNSEYFNITDNTDLSMGDIDFTFACWVKLESVSTSKSIFGKWDEAGSSREYRLWYDQPNNKFTFNVSSDGTAVGSRADNGAGVTAGVWYFIVVWHDSVNNILGLSKNGVEFTTSYSSGVFDGSADFKIGLINAFYTDGVIDEVGCWKRVLNSDERSTLYNNGNGLNYEQLTDSVYQVDLASVPAGCVIGDALMDEHATPRKYLIIDVGSDYLTVRDTEKVGSAPNFAGGSQAIIRRYYNGSTPITDWEADLDDTGLYVSGDTAQGECYNDANFNESCTINGGGTVGLTSRILTVATTDKHTGIAATGVKIVRTSTGTILDSAIANTTISWFDIQKNLNTTSIGNFVNQSVTGDAVIRNNLLRGGTSSVGTVVGINTLTNAQSQIINNIIYNVTSANAFGNNLIGVFINEGTAAIGNVNNNTIHDLTLNSGTGNCRGFYTGGGGRVTRRNNISTQIDGTTTGAIACFNGTPGGTQSNNTSSDATAAGTGSLTSIVTADQYVSTVVGSENLQLKSGSDCIGAGTDLDTTPTGVNYDIANRDREGFARGWDIGASQFIDTTVITSIGSGTTHNTNVNITALAGTGPYKLTLASASAAVAGDAIIDKNGGKYRIIEKNGNDITVVDSERYGVPRLAGNTQSIIRRYYNGSTPITDWEADLDDTPLYQSGDLAEGQCYNDAAFNESVTINGGTTVGLTKTELTVASTDRHTGIAATGARLVYTGSGTTSLIEMGSTSNSIEGVLSWLETNLNNNATITSGGIINHQNPSGNGVTTHHCIIHNMGLGASTQQALIYLSNRTHAVHNNILYDFITTGSTFRSAYGIHHWTAGGTKYIYNNTIHSLASASTSVVTNATGIKIFDENTTNCKNNIVTDVSDTDTGGGLCFNSAAYSSAVLSNNASSDATATGTGSLTSVVTADQYVSTVVGSENLQLKSGSDCIGAGTDLGTTPTGVNIDILGRDRDAEGDVWDIGAHQFTGAAAFVFKCLGILTGGIMNRIRSIKTGGQL